MKSEKNFRSVAEQFLQSDATIVQLLNSFTELVSEAKQKCNDSNEKRAHVVEILLDCIQKYLYCIIEYAEGGTAPTRSSTLQKLCIRISTTVDELKIKHEYIRNLSVATFEFLFGQPSWIAKEILRMYNAVIQHSDKAVRIEGFQDKGPYYFGRLMDELPFGDFDYQLIILETLFRICSKELLKNILKVDFMTDKIREALYEIKIEEFDLTARIFLNILNEIEKHVISILCDKVTFGDYQLQEPTELISFKGMWMDLNVRASTITLFINNESFGNDSRWEMITLFAHNITEVNTSFAFNEKKFKREGVAEIVLKGPCQLCYASEHSLKSCRTLTIHSLDIERFREIFIRTFPKIHKNVKQKTKKSLPHKKVYKPLDIASVKSYTTNHSSMNMTIDSSITGRRHKDGFRKKSVTFADSTNSGSSKTLTSRKSMSTSLNNSLLLDLDDKYSDNLIKHTGSKSKTAIFDRLSICSNLSVLEQFDTEKQKSLATFKAKLSDLRKEDDYLSLQENSESKGIPYSKYGAKFISSLLDIEDTPIDNKKDYPRTNIGTPNLDESSIGTQNQEKGTKVGSLKFNLLNIEPDSTTRMSGLHNNENKIAHDDQADEVITSSYDKTSSELSADNDHKQKKIDIKRKQEKIKKLKPKRDQKNEKEQNIKMASSLGTQLSEDLFVTPDQDTDDKNITVDSTPSAKWIKYRPKTMEEINLIKPHSFKNRSFAKDRSRDCNLDAFDMLKLERPACLPAEKFKGEVSLEPNLIEWSKMKAQNESNTETQVFETAVTHFEEETPPITLDSRNLELFQDISQELNRESSSENNSEEANFNSLEDFKDKIKILSDIKIKSPLSSTKKDSSSFNQNSISTSQDKEKVKNIEAERTDTDLKLDVIDNDRNTEERSNCSKSVDTEMDKASVEVHAEPGSENKLSTQELLETGSLTKSPPETLEKNVRDEINCTSNSQIDKTKKNLKRNLSQMESQKCTEVKNNEEIYYKNGKEALKDISNSLKQTNVMPTIKSDPLQVYSKGDSEKIKSYSNRKREDEIKQKLKPKEIRPLNDFDSNSVTKKYFSKKTKRLKIEPDSTTLVSGLYNNKLLMQENQENEEHIISHLSPTIDEADKTNVVKIERLNSAHNDSDDITSSCPLIESLFDQEDNNQEQTVAKKCETKNLSTHQENIDMEENHTKTTLEINFSKVRKLSQQFGSNEEPPSIKAPPLSSLKSENDIKIHEPESQIVESFESPEQMQAEIQNIRESPSYNQVNKEFVNKVKEKSRKRKVKVNSSLTIEKDKTYSSFKTYIDYSSFADEEESDQQDIRKSPSFATENDNLETKNSRIQEIQVDNLSSIKEDENKMSCKKEDTEIQKQIENDNEESENAKNKAEEITKTTSSEKGESQENIAHETYDEEDEIPLSKLIPKEHSKKQIKVNETRLTKSSRDKKDKKILRKKKKLGSKIEKNNKKFKSKENVKKYSKKQIKVSESETESSQDENDRKVYRKKKKLSLKTEKNNENEIQNKTTKRKRNKKESGLGDKKISPNITSKKKGEKRKMEDPGSAIKDKEEIPLSVLRYSRRRISNENQKNAPKILKVDELAAQDEISSVFTKSSLENGNEEKGILEMQEQNEKIKENTKHNVIIHRMITLDPLKDDEKSEKKLKRNENTTEVSNTNKVVEEIKVVSFGKESSKENVTKGISTAKMQNSDINTGTFEGNLFSLEEIEDKPGDSGTHLTKHESIKNDTIKKIEQKNDTEKSKEIFDEVERSMTILFGGDNEEPNKTEREAPKKTEDKYGTFDSTTSIVAGNVGMLRRVRKLFNPQNEEENLMNFTLMQNRMEQVEEFAKPKRKKNIESSRNEPKNEKKVSTGSTRANRTKSGTVNKTPGRSDKKKFKTETSSKKLSKSKRLDAFYDRVIERMNKENSNPRKPYKFTFNDTCADKYKLDFSLYKESFQKKKSVKTIPEFKIQTLNDDEKSVQDNEDIEDYEIKNLLNCIGQLFRKIANGTLKRPGPFMQNCLLAVAEQLLNI